MADAEATEIEASGHNKQNWWFKSGKQNLLEDSYSFGSTSSTTDQEGGPRWRAMAQRASSACAAAFQRLSYQVRDCFGRMRKPPPAKEERGLDEIEEIESPKYLTMLENQIGKVKDRVSHFLGGPLHSREELNNFPLPGGYERKKSREKYSLYVSPSPSPSPTIENNHSSEGTLGTCAPEGGQAEEEQTKQQVNGDDTKQQRTLPLRSSSHSQREEEENSDRTNSNFSLQERKEVEAAKEEPLILLSPANDSQCNLEMFSSCKTTNNNDTYSDDESDDDFYDAREFQYSDSDREN